MFKQIVRFKWANVILGVLAATLLIGGASMREASPPPGPGPQYKIGVLPFVDNTGSGGEDLATALSRAVQAEIAHSTQLQGRVITLDDGVTAANVDAPKAVEMGRAKGVDLVVVGTVLEASSEESGKSANGPSIGGINLGGSVHSMKAVVTLQGDLYDVTSGKQIDSIRVTGNASQNKVGADISTSLGDLSNEGASFDNSPIGKAFHNAVTSLVRKIADDQPKMTAYAGGAASGSSAGAAQSSSAGSSAACTTSGSPAPTAGPAPGAAGGAEPDLKSVKIDFIPGERTIFYDDFSDMTEGEPPPHWKVRGGKVQLRTGGGIRELDVAYDVNVSSPNLAIPKNFTFEVQMMLRHAAQWHFTDKDDNTQLEIFASGEPDSGEAQLRIDGPEGILGQGTVKADLTKPIALAIWTQEGRVRGYINGERAVDANQVSIPPPDRVVFIQDNSDGEDLWVGLRNVRLAESSPDPSIMLASTGKYVSHGIQFDTDSDRLKPESAPVIKLIAGALEKNPSLKLEIDGYTDSVGDASHNLDLSKRRAAAVQSVLVAQFGIDAGRLTSSGFSAAKPIGSNDTPDGRAANRRVEFIKK